MMAIFFSQGYAIEDRPKRAIVCAPAAYVSEVNSNAVYVQQVNITAIWPRDAGPQNELY